MAFNLGGLGQGLGAIGLGVSKGELAGSAQQQRLHQQHAMELYRQGLLDQQKQKSADTATSAAARLKQMKQAPYQHSLANAELWGFYHAPENAHILAEHMARAGYTGVDPDTLPPDPNFDPVTGALKPPTAGGPPGAGGVGAPPPDAGAAAPAAPYTGPNTQPAPFDFAPPSESPFTLGQGGLAGPRGYNTPFDTAPSTQIQQPPQMPAVFPGEPSGGLPPYTPEPPAPGAEPTPGTPATPAEPPPYDPSALLAQRRREGPNPGQTPKQFKDEMAGYARDAGLGVRQGLAPHQANFYDATAAERVMQGTRTAQQIKQEPEKFASEQAHRAAQINLAGAQEGQIRALTPERVNQIRSTIQTQADHVKIAARNAQTAIDRLTEANRHNRADESIRRDALNSQDKLRQAQINHIQTTIKLSAGLHWSDTEKEVAKQSLAVISAVDKDAAGVAHPRFGADVINKAIDNINKVYTDHGTPPMFNGSTSPGAAAGQAGAAKVTAGAGLQAPSQLPLTAAERMGVGRLIKTKSVNSALNAPGVTPAQKARLQYVYQQLTGKPL